uniref:Uncharacterized protein n=1 Tax=Spongospora subterranea TaxID=70186 RepID=A0A0H5QJ76_9EUKA|eukprot:CRZ02058.1 hypothetical protein [Spongospora subterranea]
MTHDLPLICSSIADAIINDDPSLLVQTFKVDRHQFLSAFPQCFSHTGLDTNQVRFPSKILAELSSLGLWDLCLLLLHQYPCHRRVSISFSTAVSAAVDQQWQLIHLFLDRDYIPPNIGNNALLRVALVSNNPVMVTRLLSYDAVHRSISSSSPCMVKCLFRICQNGCIDSLRIVMEKSLVNPAIYRYRAVIIAAQYGHEHLVSILLPQLLPLPVSQTISCGMTSLITAVRLALTHGHFGVAHRLLLIIGPDILSRTWLSYMITIAVTTKDCNEGAGDIVSLFVSMCGHSRPSLIQVF